ncbi:sugar phosphate isomerase/epimerase [Roseimicrobium gellanilyticum]|uniref:Sugar phosphate isomerase/epimerase n=1 Tax=Roseimicrobium gellanilyticum TaxID=748857 RepID=A0A366HL03_9BACT|nr:sugar phosphate isomerase/epimerase family protein [Roseimicrobium gellanilyticum]RBP43613.1 sugar phosphate isomerase/epimerase [Roseimicrobium gellanilyticum]
MPISLGFVTAILPELSFEEVTSFAATEGFSTIEVMCWPTGKAERRFAGVTHIDVTSLTKGAAEDILAQCQHARVSISALGYYPNMLDPDAEVSRAAVAHFKKVIAAAPKLGLKRVNGFVGRDWTKTVDENWPRFLKIWKPIIQYAEDHDVKIGIENCPMSFTRDEWPGGKNLLTTPAIWRRAFSDIDSPNFGLNYDPSHFILQGMDPIRPLAEFRDKLFHLHAKDVKIDHAALNEVGRFDFPLRWHQPRIPGFGDINWAAFMGEVMRIGYDGPLCIEVEDDTFGKTLEGRKSALRVARNVLAPFVG